MDQSLSERVAMAAFGFLACLLMGVVRLTNLCFLFVLHRTVRKAQRKEEDVLDTILADIEAVGKLQPRFSTNRCALIAQRYMMEEDLLNFFLNKVLVKETRACSTSSRVAGSQYFSSL